MYQLDELAPLIAAILQQACLDVRGFSYRTHNKLQSGAQEFLNLAGIGEDMQQRILEGMSQRGEAKRQQVQTAKEQVKSMATTLEQDIARLDRTIADLKTQAENASTTVMRDKLNRKIELLDVHERGAIKRRHEAEAARQLAEHEARESVQQQLADQAIEQFTRAARARWIGTDADFQAALPGLIQTWKSETALGRMPAEQPIPRDRTF